MKHEQSIFHQNLHPDHGRASTGIGLAHISKSEKVNSLQIKQQLGIIDQQRTISLCNHLF